jgi:hypothetical protein
MDASFMSSDNEIDESMLTDSAVDALYKVSRWDASPL